MNTKAIYILIASTLLLTACGGGSGSAASKVEYSDKVAAGTVADYSNADWLYQNYFGDYGLPKEVKPFFIPSLQMLANGFVMQLKTGQDVRKNIEQVHSLFLQYTASGQATKFFAQVQNDIQENEIQVTKKVDDASNPYFVEPTISNEDKIAIEQAKQRDLAEELEIQKLAEQYQLPYKIAEQKEQWFIYTPTMKGGGKGGASSGGGTSSKPKNHQNINSWGWRPGDVVWVNGAGSITGVPGHVAMITPTENGLSLIDANTDVGVSQRYNIQGWMDRYTEVRALTPRLNWSWDEYNCYYSYGSSYCRSDSWIRYNSFQHSLSHVGAPYNWNFTNPRDTTQFYCTSLLWHAYDNYGYNIVAPWRLGYYGMITPAQIRDSGALATFKISAI